VEKKIRYVCSEINNVEWSGTLFYRTLQGTLDSPENLILKCEDFYLQDKGSAAHTAFTFSEDILDIYDLKPELEECKTAMLHSHNHMATFFSGTDMDELNDNCGLYDFYLSLIVNNKGDRLAKISYMGKQVVKRNVSSKYKNSFGAWVNIIWATPEEEKEEDVMFHHDVDIEIENVAPEFETFFLDRVQKIAHPVVTTPTYNPGNYYQPSLNFGQDKKTNHYGGYNRTYNDGYDFNYESGYGGAYADDDMDLVSDRQAIEFINRLLTDEKEIGSFPFSLKRSMENLKHLKGAAAKKHLQKSFIHFDRIKKVVFPTSHLMLPDFDLLDKIYSILLENFPTEMDKDDDSFLAQLGEALTAKEA